MHEECEERGGCRVRCVLRLPPFCLAPSLLVSFPGFSDVWTDRTQRVKLCILRILDGEAELIARIPDIDRHELKKDFSAILARLPSTYERVLGDRDFVLQGRKCDAYDVSAGNKV